jgi:hypothetical protein
LVGALLEAFEAFAAEEEGTGAATDAADADAESTALLARKLNRPFFTGAGSAVKFDDAVPDCAVVTVVAELGAVEPSPAIFVSTAEAVTDIAVAVTVATFSLSDVKLGTVSSLGFCSAATLSATETDAATARTDPGFIFGASLGERGASFAIATGTVGLPRFIKELTCTAVRLCATITGAGAGAGAGAGGSTTDGAALCGRTGDTALKLGAGCCGGGGGGLFPDSSRDMPFARCVCVWHGCGLATSIQVSGLAEASLVRTDAPSVFATPTWA